MQQAVTGSVGSGMAYPRPLALATILAIFCDIISNFLKFSEIVLILDLLTLTIQGGLREPVSFNIKLNNIFHLLHQ